MLHSFLILKKYGLVIQNHIGPFTKDDMQRVKSKVLDHPDFEPSHNFLVDLRDTEINMTNKDLIEYETWLTSHPILGNIKKFAIFTNTPDQFATAFVYVENAGIRVDHYEIFRTLGSALEWLNIDPSHKSEINKELKKMVASPQNV